MIIASTTGAVALRRRLTQFIGVFLAFSCALALASCGADDSGKSSGALGAQGSDDAAVGGARFHTADEETAKLGSDAPEGQFPRTVVHASGTTEIPAAPERVVVLDTGELDAVLALGVKPVGIVTTRGENPVPSYLADKVEGIPSVGTIADVNVEAVAELRPDLIIGSQVRAEKIYPQLAEIAPTVFSIRPGLPWKENFLLAGEALGKEAKAREVLNEYADAVAELRDSAPDGVTVSMVRFMPERLRLYAKSTFIGVILDDAGISRPENQNIEDHAVEISPERIAEADADVIFWASYGDPDASGEAAVIEGDAWKNLSAVKEGRAYRVDDDSWYLGLGPLGAEIVVKELREYLTS